MNCPFCNSVFVVYNPNTMTECCSNRKCCLSVKPDGDEFWNDFLTQIKQLEVNAVKRADEERKCFSCTYFNSVEKSCGLNAIDGIYATFGCAEWERNKDIPLGAEGPIVAWLVKLESCPEVIVFTDLQGKAANIAQEAYIQSYGRNSGLPCVLYTRRAAQYDKSPLNKSITPHAYSVEAVNKSLGGSNG